MNDKALKYLHAVGDAAQNPGARVDVHFGCIIMYQRSASLAVESTNQANKAARDRTLVDVVCATKLLLSLSAKRYHESKEMAWKWQGHLTPYGETLQAAAFENINFDITPSILLNRRQCGTEELQEMDKDTPKGIASFKRNQMEDLRLEAVPVVSHTLMESLVITWWLLLSCPELKA